MTDHDKMRLDELWRYNGIGEIFAQLAECVQAFAVESTNKDWIQEQKDTVRYLRALADDYNKPEPVSHCKAFQALFPTEAP